MMPEFTGKHLCKKSLAVLLCLFLTGNVAHGTVLCFGADGHIEFESAFHTHCDDHGHDQSSDHGLQSFETAHEGGGRCGPCVDVPVAVDFVKISRDSNTFGCIYAAIEASIASECFNPGMAGFKLYPNIILPTASCASLRTVILLI